jgi:hypothetical protein
MIMWARENGAPWDTETLVDAVRYGQMHVVQWCFANGAPYDEMTAAYAAHVGRLDILKWLRANGVPWDDTVYVFAAREGELEAMDWAFDNGCPFDPQSTTVCWQGAFYGHIDVIEWGLAHGDSGDDIYYGAAEGGEIDVVKWAWDRGIPLCRCQRRCSCRKAISAMAYPDYPYMADVIRALGR